MRGLWSTIASVLVLAGLGAYIYFVTWKMPENEPGKKLEKVFASLQADTIDELTVALASGDSTTLKKDNGVWQMTQPVAAKADDAEIGSITSSLSSIEIVRVVDENPTSLNDYGLSNPRMEVSFKAAGDKEPRTLLIGEKSPTGADLFAMRGGDKKVFLLSSTQETTFGKSSFDLREKVLLQFDRDKIDGIDVTAAGKTLAVVKDGSEWKLTRPVQVRADFGAVEGLVGRLETAQMKSIVTNEVTPADLKKYGLDKPDVTVNLNAGSARATLVVGGAAAENTVYARDASKAMVVTVESALLDDLKKSADDYRRRDLFEFRAYNADRVEISRGDQTTVFERTKAPPAPPAPGAQAGGNTWKRVSPNPADVDRDKVDALLAKLANMRATSFVESAAKTGLDKPAMTVYVKFEDGKKEERITFGQTGADTFASRPGDPGAMKTDTTDFNESLKSLDDISK